MSDTSSVIIEEVAGQKRKVELRGPALPFQGASWKTQQGMSTTWYPGNGIEGTQHIMGPREMPSMWEGVWRRTMMGKVPSIYTENGADIRVTTPAFLRDAIDGIFYVGTRLRVTWLVVKDDGRRFSVVREGRCQEWEFPHDRVDDINWKFNFEWLGRGGTIQKVVALRDNDIDSGINGLDAAINDLVVLQATLSLLSKKKNNQFGASSLTLGQLEALADYPNALLKSVTRQLQSQINKLKRLADLVNKVRNIPYQLTHTALNFAKNTVAICNQYRRTQGQVPSELTSVKNSYHDLVRSMKLFGKSDEQVKEIARQAQEFGDQQKIIASRQGPHGGQQPVNSVSGTRPGDVHTVHICRQGDTPATLSSYFYNSPDHALDILKANKLPWNLVAFKPGKIIIIPVLGVVKTTTGTG